ncbi:MAG: MnmC family methyltransferase [Spirochaetes bacterium]|nr:MnmC family methyltransferase [Spirochaetota bacterium]
MEQDYLLITDDGTSTLFLEEYNQAMHSISGAYDEALLKHIIPSRILDSDNAELNVLDIGFGIGYNVLALINEFMNRKKGSRLNIISLEKEKYFFKFMKDVRFNDQKDHIYDLIKDAYYSGSMTYNDINLKILFGDARVTVNMLKGEKFNAIFHDPFSPSKNPELWSVDFFYRLKDIMSEDAILTTYSSADHIRRAMLEAQLYVGIGPSVGKKREGTIAAVKKKIIEIDEIDNERKSRIMGNIKSVPYRDSNLDLSREKILENRLIEIAQIRNKFKQDRLIHLI